MAMSRKHYEDIAAMLRDVKRIESDAPHAKHRLEAIKYVEYCIAELLADDNPRFDATRFHHAAGWYHPIAAAALGLEDE